MDLQMKPRIRFAFVAAAAHRWLTFSLLSTRTPRPLSATLFPSHTNPSLYSALWLCHPRTLMVFKSYICFVFLFFFLIFYITIPVSWRDSVLHALADWKAWGLGMAQCMSTLTIQFGSGVYFWNDLLDLPQLLHFAQSEFGVWTGSFWDRTDSSDEL